MKTIIIAIIIAMACASRRLEASVQDKSDSEAAPLAYVGNQYVYRVYDPENGVTCYVGGHYSGGISCVKN